MTGTRPTRRAVLGGGAAAIAGFATATILQGDDAPPSTPESPAPESSASESAAPVVPSSPAPGNGSGVALSSAEDAGDANAAAINDALTADPFGRVLLPPGRYPIADTVVIPDIAGAGLVGSGAAVTELFQSPGADLDAMVASQRWLDGSTFSQLPCVVGDLTLDGSRDDQGGGLGHGLVHMAYGSVVLRLRTVRTRGDGIHLANGNRDGGQIENDAVENRFIDCEARFNGGYGLHAPYTEGPGRPGTTDTWVERFICEAPGLGYLRSDRAGGWKVLAAQCYSSSSPPDTLGHGIELRSCYGTTVADCNIDKWGGRPGLSTAAGLMMQGLSGRPSVVIGNVFETSEVDGTEVAAILLESAGGNQPHWTVTGNTATSTASAPRLRFAVLAHTGGDGANHGLISANGANVVDPDEPFDGGSSQAAGSMRVDGNSFNFAARPPVAGYWPRSTMIRNQDVRPGEPWGWVCTESGRPGTWTSLGVV